MKTHVEVFLQLLDKPKDLLHKERYNLRTVQWVLLVSGCLLFASTWWQGLMFIVYCMVNAWMSEQDVLISLVITRKETIEEEAQDNKQGE